MGARHLRVALIAAGVTAIPGTALATPPPVTPEDFALEAQIFIEEADGELADTMNVTFSDATCEVPADVTIGTPFTCQATGDDGQHYRLDVVIDGDRSFTIGEVEPTVNATPDDLEAPAASFSDSVLSADGAAEAEVPPVVACSVDQNVATCFALAGGVVLVGTSPWPSGTTSTWSAARYVPDPTDTAPTTPTSSTIPSPASTSAVPPEYTNALRSAEQYLSFTAFSLEGLVEQLEFEQFSSEAARWAAENVTVDWNEQAALSAASYLDFSAFSEGGLRDQLAFEEFTPEQIDFAIAEMQRQGRL